MRKTSNSVPDASAGVTMIVRISRGNYPIQLHDKVTERLAASSKVLLPAIRALPGCIEFYAATEKSSSSMINVIVWDSMEHAQKMGELAPMLALAKEFTDLGVEFERPIVNYTVLWRMGSE
jgi:quinol monooxygenase YgiN